MTDQEKMTKMLGEILTITDKKCLKTIQDTAYNRQKDLYRHNANIKTLSWQVGDAVQLSPEHRNRKPYGAVGKIQKINKVRITVDFGNGMLWNVPKAMLMKAK